MCGNIDDHVQAVPDLFGDADLFADRRVDFLMFSILEQIETSTANFANLILMIEANRKLLDFPNGAAFRLDRQRIC